jgi:hypothetical protein
VRVSLRIILGFRPTALELHWINLQSQRDDISKLVPPFIPQNTTFFREQGDGLYGTGAGNRTLHAKATLTVRLSLGKGCQRDLSSRPNQFHEAHNQGSLILVQPFPV